MPILRTIVKIWIGFLVGVSTAVTAISVVPPQSSFTRNVLVGAGAFLLGSGAMAVLDRLVAPDTAIAHTEAAEVKKELVAV